MKKQGKERVYNLEAEKLKTVHDWVKSFEQFWGHQLDRIKEAPNGVRVNDLNRQHPRNRRKDNHENGNR